jgi:TrwC relaxase
MPPGQPGVGGALGYWLPGSPSLPWSGRWVGTGLAAMGVDGQVSEAQMKALLGEGLHPDADARVQEALSRGVDREAAVAAVRLGRRLPTIDQSHQVWRDRLLAAYAGFETAHGRRPERGPERDLVRWNVAYQLFRENHKEASSGHSTWAHARSAAPGVSVGAISARDSWEGLTAQLLLNAWALGASSWPLTLEGCRWPARRRRWLR